MKSFTKIAIGICFLAFVGACRDDKDFSDVPELFYRDFEVVDEGGNVGLVATWKLGFTDGDGNIGVREGQNDPDNFILTGYRIDSGKVKVLEDITNSRIPAAPTIPTRNGVEGEFVFTFKLALLQINNIDSAYFEAYVVDRDLNESNSVQTPMFLN